MPETYDVGFVHVLTEPGGECRADCPHPSHDAEVSDYLRRARHSADLIRRGLVPGEENE